MLNNFVKFFIRRHLLTNLFFFIVIIVGAFGWFQLKKEELPDITFDRVRISVSYPGASAEEVEYYVTRPIEDALRGVDGICNFTSSTSAGSSQVSVEIEPYYPDKDEVISELRNTVLDVKLPEDITDDPRIRVFKTSRKAIIDIGLIFRGKRVLDVKSRQVLQTYMLNLEHQLMNLPEISSVNRSGYLKEEYHIKIKPSKLKEYNIPFNTVMREILNNNVRQPAGSIENIKEPKVTLYGELNTIEELKDLSIQGGFEGQVVRLKDISEVVKGYEKTKSITKINGHEGIFLNAIKSGQYGILEALKSLNKLVKDFEKNNLKGSSIELILLDDESVDVRNRLSLIKTNGTIGFIFIILILLIFLDFRSGLWVAMGIPFTFCFTIIVANFFGYSINNITLAAVIIVMGMVVDDAIVVAENIKRYRSQGMEREKAGILGTAYVFTPIVASILTTCVAFIPLYFFRARFGMMVRFIPPIVFIMLGGSLLEALIILPGHMILTFKNKADNKTKKKHWFDSIEDYYGIIIEKLLKFKWFIFIIFIGLFIYSLNIAHTKMKFLMFPDEETRQIRLSGEAPPGTLRYETAKLTQKLEDIIMKSVGNEVIGFRNQIARSRRGSAVKENTFRMRIEILPKEKREKSADQIISEWRDEFIKAGLVSKDAFDRKNKKNENEQNKYTFSKLRVSKTWHGQSSDSPIEILIKENDDKIRSEVSNQLVLEMKQYEHLENVEIDQPMTHPEYHIKLNRDKIRRLAINPSDIAKTLRASLEGTILYEFSGKDEPIYVRLTIIESAKNDIKKVLDLPIENQGKYLVPLNDIVSIEKVNTPDSIIREDMKRTTFIYADLKKGTKKTPLEIAEYFESKVFPKIQSKFSSTLLEFGGEIKDSRESRNDFKIAITLVILFIYIILILIFNSLLKPFIIMVSIPFGIVGIILAFWLHGIMFYGFFAIIGALGLAGVIVNDAIIMVVKLDKEYEAQKTKEENRNKIAQIAKTRLRAVVLTTLTTVAGMIPTAYGWAGYDAMLAQMMLALSWGLLFGTMITLILIPCLYNILRR